jgi:signal transduction histidine kinase
MSLIIFTPTVFSNIEKTSEGFKIITGPLISLFGLFAVGLIFESIYRAITKARKANGIEKRRWIYILFGTFSTLLLLIIFNFIMPSFFGFSSFISYMPLFLLPLAILISYAILKYRLLDIKVVATETLTFGTAVAIVARMLYSDSLASTIFDLVFLVVFAVFSILLIRSVLNEVRQREQLQKLTDELQKANVRLKELDELKTEFMSIATHQLRTPLSIIKGYTSLMDEGAYGKMSKQAKEVLGNIDISNERLIKMVDEFLDVSRIEKGKTQYSFAEIDFAKLSEGVVAELKEKAMTKDITLDLKINKDIKNITADEERIRHCVYNFVDNAIKYSPEKSTIKILIEKEKDGVNVRVADQGVGLDAKDLKNLFQKFYRSEHVVRDFQGTGLGLFVVKEFAEAHGGHVWAKSEGVGKGSEFGFWVPLKGVKGEGVTGEGAVSDGVKNKEVKKV